MRLPKLISPSAAILHTLTNRTGTLAARLESRSVIRFSGPDTAKFLQGLVTNDVVAMLGGPAEATATSSSSYSRSLPTPNLPVVSFPPLYAALLTPQGRFLYDFFLYRPPSLQDSLNASGFGPGSGSDSLYELLADVDSRVVDELLQTLKRYRLRAKVEIENVAGEFSCWQRFGGEIAEKLRAEEEPEAANVGWCSGVDSSAMSASHGSDDGWQWFKDPRLECLGFRGIFPSGMTPSLVEADKETDERNYLLWRMQLGVAEGSSEIPKGEAVPLEYNQAGLNAISFNKGCYVGQELIARTHHRGVIRKRLLPLCFEDADGKEVEQRATPGSEVIDGSSGKKVGSVTTTLGCRGMGLLRLEEAFKSGSLNIQGQEDVKVPVNRPKWWPAEWFPENQERDNIPTARRDCSC